MRKGCETSQIAYLSQAIRSEAQKEVCNVQKSTSTSNLEVKDEPMLVMLLILKRKPTKIDRHIYDEDEIWQAQSPNRPLLSTRFSVDIGNTDQAAYVRGRNREK